MKVHFLAPHPLFGRKTAPLPLKEQERSPYYWWWAYLRRSEAYLKCCEKGGKGPLAKLYADFGDVREDDFRKWWTTGDHGAQLFAEQRQSVKFGQLKDAAEWHPDWTTDRALIIAIPLNMSKRLIKTGVSKLLDSHIQSRRGRKALRDAESSALYPLARNYTAQNLKTALAVYDLWHMGKFNPEEKLYYWEIGVKVGLNRLSVKDAKSSDKHARYEARNRLNATVLRYVKEAQKIIKGIEQGEFPAA